MASLRVVGVPLDAFQAKVTRHVRGLNLDSFGGSFIWTVVMLWHYVPRSCYGSPWRPLRVLQNDCIHCDALFG